MERSHVSEDKKRSTVELSNEQIGVIGVLMFLLGWKFDQRLFECLFPITEPNTSVECIFGSLEKEDKEFVINVQKACSLAIDRTLALDIMKKFADLSHLDAFKGWKTMATEYLAQLEREIWMEISGRLEDEFRASFEIVI